MIGSKNLRSEFSREIEIKTLKEPLTGEQLHKAIIKENLNEVAEILDSPFGKRIIDIPDRFGNLPLMIAVNRNHIE